MDSSVVRSAGGGWSQSGICRTKDTNVGVSMAVNLPPSETYTVQFKVTNIHNITAGVSSINPVAEVTWTINGTPVRRLVSVGSGTSVSGTGSSVRVVVKDATDINDASSPAGVILEYDVTITLAPGLRPISQPAMYLSYIPTGAPPVVSLGFVSIPGAGSVTIPIPQDAGIISSFITITNPVAPFTTDTGTALVSEQGTISAYKTYNPFFRQWVPMAPQATEINIANNIAANSIFASVIWGIDG